MKSRAHQGLLLLVLTAGLAGCEGGRAPTTPAAPTGSTRPTATLSGVVFTVAPTGLSPVQGARVRLEIGSFRQESHTDQSGRYRLTELYDGTSSVTTTLAGYDTETRTVPISGDVVFDVRMEPQVGHLLSGQVFEMTPAGRVPLEGVRIDWPDGHAESFTASDGLFTFSVLNGVTTLGASKDGYRTVFVQATVRGDTRFDIQLVRR